MPETTTEIEPPLDGLDGVAGVLKKNGGSYSRFNSK